MKSALLISALIAVGCGKSGPLTGPVGLRFIWEGAWSNPDRDYLESFVTQLADGDYFAPLRAQGIAPHFFVDDTSKYVIRISAQDGTLPGCAWHSSNGEIVIAPKCSTWFNGLVTRALSHELVEFAVDPGADDPSHELADACGRSVKMTVAGRQVVVAQYMVGGTCYPAAP